MTPRARRIRKRLQEVGLLPAALRICREHAVSFAAVWSDSRVPPLPFARALIYGAIRRAMLWPYTKIASFLEVPDHSTVFYAVAGSDPSSADIERMRRRARMLRVAKTVRELKAQNRRAA